MEIEAKFAIANRQEYRDLLRVRTVAGFALVPTGHVKMADRYFDTAEGRLLDAGYACRIRTDPKGVLASLKGLGGAEGALHRRDEQEVRLPEWSADPQAWPPSAARTLALTLTGGEPLQTLFDLEQDRARAQVMAGTRAVAELSLDEVRAAVGRRPAFYYELEIELLPDGTEAELTAIAAAFQHEHQLTPETRSKFERALAVLRSRGTAVQGRLDEDELQSITDIRHGGNVELSRRAGAVLGWAEGLPTREIVARTGLSSGRVRFWLREWRSRRMGIFEEVARESETEDSPKAPLLPTAPRPPAPESLPPSGPGFAAPPAPENPAPMRLRKSGLPAVADFAAENGVDLAHARCVADLAASLFEAFAPVHRLPRKRRKLLRQAALVATIGARQDPQRPHRAGRDLILAQPLHDVDTSDRLVLACVVAFQREKVKPDREPAIQALAPRQRQLALVLAALLQMAEALDGARTQATTLVAVEDCDEMRCDVTVAGPAAELDALQATAASGLWQHLTGRAVRFVAQRPAASAAGAQRAVPDIAPPTPPAIEIPPLRADEPMSEAGRKTLFTHFLKMLANEAGTRLGEDIEALHDMRVATRRMRAAYRIFAPHFAEETLAQFNKDLRRAGRTLGAVRDLDVLIEAAAAYEAEHGSSEDASIAPLLDDWHARRELARRDLLAYLNSSQYARFVERFRTFLTTPGEGTRRLAPGEPTPHEVRHVCPRLILERYESVRAYESVLDGAPLTTYHALRIEFKGLRYALEFFRDVLGSETPALIKQITGLQDVLGALQDAHVAEALVTQFLAERAKRRKKVEAINLTGVTGYLAVLQARQQELLTRFPQPWAEVTGREFRRNLALAVTAP